MKFKAYIKKISQVRKASEDMENQLVLITEDAQPMVLSAYPSDTVFDVQVEPERKE